MSVHKLSPPCKPCNKSLSDSNVQLYDVGCTNFVLDTRKALSNSGFVESNNAQKDLRRRQFPCASESAKDVRIRTNKILQTQNRARKGFIEEFMKRAGITAKGLQTIHAANSEERFWSQNASLSRLSILSKSRLTLMEPKMDVDENIDGNFPDSSSQSNVGVVKPLYINYSKVNLQLTPEDLQSGQDKERASTNQEPPTSLAESRSRLLLGKGKRHYQRVSPFKPDLQNNNIPTILVEKTKSALSLLNPGLKPKEPKIKTKSNPLRIEDLSFHILPIHDNIRQSESKTSRRSQQTIHKQTSVKSKFRQANNNTDTEEMSEYSYTYDDSIICPSLTPEPGEKLETDLKEKPLKQSLDGDKPHPQAKEEESGTSSKNIPESNTVTETEPNLQEQEAEKQSQLHEQKPIKLSNSITETEPNLQEQQPEKHSQLHEQKRRIRRKNKIHKQQSEKQPPVPGTQKPVKQEIVFVDVCNSRSPEVPLVRSLSRTQRSRTDDDQYLVHESRSMKKIISTPRFEPVPPPGNMRRVEIVEDFHLASSTNERSKVRKTHGGSLQLGSTVSSMTSLKSDTDDEICTSKTNLFENPRKKPKHASTLNRAAALKRRAEEAQKKALERALKKAAEEEAERLRLEAIAAALAARYAAFSDYEIRRAPVKRKKNKDKVRPVLVSPPPKPLELKIEPQIEVKQEQPEVVNVPQLLLYDTEPVVEIEPKKTSVKKKMEIYDEIPSEPEKYETIKFQRKWEYESPLLEKLLAKPILTNFVSPIIAEKAKKKKKLAAPKPPKAKKSLPPPPRQPPTGLRTYEEELKAVPAVVKPLEFHYERTRKVELIRAIAEFRDFDVTSKDRMIGRPWLQGRLAFSKQICRFEIPPDLSTLRGMSPVEYITDYSVISPRRIKLYTEVFNRQLELRKSKKSFTKVLNRSTLNPNKFTLGGVKTREGMHADMKYVTRGRDEHTSPGHRSLNTEDSLTLKETADGLEKIHVGGVEDLQVEKMFRLLRLVGKESIMESKERVNCTLFCAMCALLERMFYLHFLVKDAHHETDDRGTRLMLEMADFFGFNAKIKNIRLDPGLRELFNFLTK